MIEQGRRVVAFGDSDVDTLMLQGAEKAVVVGVEPPSQRRFAAAPARSLRALTNLAL